MSQNFSHANVCGCEEDILIGNYLSKFFIYNSVDIKKMWVAADQFAVQEEKPSAVSSSQFFSQDELSSLKKRTLPRHVAIMMDGNRRWAKKHSLMTLSAPFTGHWMGAKALVNIVEASLDIGIKVLTVFGFSTENWSRSPSEIEVLQHIFAVYLKENRQKLMDQGVRFDVIGEISAFPSSLRTLIEEVKVATSQGSKMDFVIAMNYGGRDEMKRVCVKIAKDVNANKIKLEEITEELISTYTDTNQWGDPDLLIRTSGESRISNFMLWQVAYSEIYFTDVLWPDFSPKHLLQAIHNFQERQRRFGR